MAAAKLKVAIVSPERTVFDGPAEMVVVPAWDGELGILRGHAPMLALLGKGTLRVTDGQAESRFEVDGGFLQVADDTVIVLSERASAAPA
jgi:F-type H+-transporting ATPase subunit epsilon